MSFVERRARLSHDSSDRLACYDSEDEDDRPVSEVARVPRADPHPVQRIQPASPPRSEPIRPPLSKINENIDGYGEEWTYVCYQKILDKTKKLGIDGVKWSNVLGYWSETLANVGAEEITNVSKILAFARLTKSGKPMSLEMLRRLGEL
jgi:hypothetical protein